MLWQWLGQHGMTLLQVVSIVSSLLFTAFSIRAETRERRIQNIFTITSGHREIWKMALEWPELRNVLRDKPDEGPSSVPTFAESRFVGFLIHHLAAAFRARTYGMFLNEKGLASDIREFFSKPIPRAVWNSSKTFQDPDFVKFVDASLFSAR